MWRRSLVTACVLAAVCSSGPAGAQGRFDEGRMTLGLGGGGGQGSFHVAGNFGYFVVDRLRPGISLAYSWQDLDPGAMHTFETSASLRYYFFEHEMVSPFALVETGHIHMVVSDFSEALDGEFDYFSVAGGGGVFVVLGQAFGLEVTGGIIQYLGADDALTKSGVIEEGPAFWWNVGFALVL